MTEQFPGSENKETIPYLHRKYIYEDGARIMTTHEDTTISPVSDTIHDDFEQQPFEFRVALPPQVAQELFFARQGVVATEQPQVVYMQPHRPHEDEGMMGVLIVTAYGQIPGNPAISIDQSFVIYQTQEDDGADAYETEVATEYTKDGVPIDADELVSLSHDQDKLVGHLRHSIRHMTQEELEAFHRVFLLLEKQ